MDCQTESSASPRSSKEISLCLRDTTDFHWQELTDGLNFGLYLPPCNGRAGKFLDESRCLKEYPLSGPVSFLEVRIEHRQDKEDGMI